MSPKFSGALLLAFTLVSALTYTTRGFAAPGDLDEVAKFCKSSDSGDLVVRLYRLPNENDSKTVAVHLGQSGAVSVDEKIPADYEGFVPVTAELSNARHTLKIRGEGFAKTKEIFLTANCVLALTQYGIRNELGSQ